MNKDMLARMKRRPNSRAPAVLPMRRHSSSGARRGGTGATTAHAAACVTRAVDDVIEGEFVEVGGARETATPHASAATAERPQRSRSTVITEFLRKWRAAMRTAARRPPQPAVRAGGTRASQFITGLYANAAGDAPTSSTFRRATSTDNRCR